MNSCDANDVKLLRYLDNELSDRELEDFSSHLRTCPDCRARLEEQRELSQIFRQSRPLYPAPEALRNRVAAITQESLAKSTLPRFRQRISQVLMWPMHRKIVVAAALVIIGCLIFIPDVVLQHVRAANYVETAVTLHRNCLSGQLPLEIRSDSPAAVSAWISNKVSFPFRLPASQSDLESEPVYRLSGARLVNYNGSRAALVTYETANGKISLLVASGGSAEVTGGDEVRSGNLTFHYRSKENFKVITWTSHGLAYALVSSISAPAQGSCMVCHQNMSDHNVLPRPQ